ncbi:MAG: GH92 family glycosyl hydrolase [Bacteroidales bacterium]|jgi:predicted alpha-1,2-mannosidase|nr:GH92 family glycosyl hydrolase [Bacteroidales bacterium]
MRNYFLNVNTINCFAKIRQSNLFVFSLFLLSLPLASCQHQDHSGYSKSEGLLQYVDPLIGADFHGHVFVGTSTPFGMVQVGPNNIHKGWDWCSGYHYSDSIVTGFSHLHLSGTGGTDLGDVLVMPYTGEIRSERGEQKDISNGYASFYTHDREVARPEYYSLWLKSYGIKAELTSSDRVGFHRYTFPKDEQARVIVDLKQGAGDRALDAYIKQTDEYTIEGYRYSKGWSTHRVFFTMKCNKPLKEFAVFDDNDCKDGKRLQSPAAKGVMSFGDRAGEVMFKVGLSSVSCANAAEHIRLEIDGWDFAKAVKENSRKWNEELSKVVIETKSEPYKRVFYTSFYHTMIDPALYCDYNGEFRAGNTDSVWVAKGWKNYTVLSLWDTYRTLHPLMTIIQQEKVDDLINTMLSIFDQQGKLPIWHLQGWETNLMPGCSAIPVVADAYLKGFRGFDGERAFHAVKTSATSPEQRQMPYILERGYIPGDKVPEGTSLAMEYAADDWGIAEMARRMGKTDDYEYFKKRSRYYKTYFDKSINFIRPKMDDGSWRTPYDPARAVHGLRGDYCEGNGWQYTFFVPQDPCGLIELFGSDDAFTQKLDDFFVTETDMGPEASKDITGLIGQYAHGNEPSHHIAYMYAYAGQQWKTAEKVRFIMDQFYTDKPDGIIGNEDCGQMSAWYMMSSFGFYPVNPAQGVYVFGSPHFDKVTVNLPGGKTFVIEAVNNSMENIYIQNVELNGKEYSKSCITHQDVVNGGTLKFVMGSKPGKDFGTARENRPI